MKYIRFKKSDPNLKDDIEILDNSINQLLNNINEQIKIQGTDRWNDKSIKSCNIDYRFKKGQLHTHIIFKIRHFTKIQLIYKKLKIKYVMN